MLDLNEYGQFTRDMRPVIPVATTSRHQDPDTREYRTCKVTVPGEPVPGTEHLAIIPAWMRGIRRDHRGHRFGVSLTGTWVETWAVCHIPTGLRVPPPHVNFLEMTREFARKLVATGYDWSLRDIPDEHVMTVVRELMTEMRVMDDRALSDSARLDCELRALGVQQHRHSDFHCAA